MKPEILKGKNLEKFVNQALAQQLPVKYVTKMISLSYGGMFSAEEIRDSLSDGQLLSKLWLLDKFELIAKSDMNVCIVGGWLGQLANLLFLNKPQVKNIVRQANIKSTANNGLVSAGVSRKTRYKTDNSLKL